jgi:hypothetical protein
MEPLFESGSLESVYTSLNIILSYEPLPLCTCIDGRAILARFTLTVVPGEMVNSSISLLRWNAGYNRCVLDNRIQGRLLCGPFDR